jgi:molybdate transport system ATP-binding protein
LLASAPAVLVGSTVRLRIPAREVILATRAPEGVSLHNVLQGSVSAVHIEPAVDHAIVQLRVGNVRLLAEVTLDAVSALGIEEGQQLHALVKSVSIDVLAGDGAVETSS